MMNSLLKICSPNINLTVICKELDLDELDHNSRSPKLFGKILSRYEELQNYYMISSKHETGKVLI